MASTSSERSSRIVVLVIMVLPGRSDRRRCLERITVLGGAHDPAVLVKVVRSRPNIDLHSVISEVDVEAEQGAGNFIELIDRELADFALNAHVLIHDLAPFLID